MVDTNGDGQNDTMGFDTNGDGRIDAKELLAALKVLQLQGKCLTTTTKILIIKLFSSFFYF